MKSVLKNIIMYLIILSPVMVSSCGETDEKEEILPPKPTLSEIKAKINDNSFFLDRSTNINYADNSIKIDAKLEVYDDLYKLGVSIANVVYYFDDKIIGSSSAAPYTLSATVEKVAPGIHYLKAIITLVGGEINYPYTYKAEINTTPAEKPKIDIYVDYNKVWTGDNFTISAYINRSTSEPDLKINKTTLKWNGKEVGTSTLAPYSVSKKVTELESDSIDIEYNVEYSYKNVKGELYKRYKIGIEKEVPEGSTYSEFSFNLCTENRTFRNGDYLMGICKGYMIDRSKHSTANFKVAVLIDNDVICEPISFPYIFEYELENLSIGEHKIRFRSEYYDGDALVNSITTDKYIIKIIE